VRTEDKDEMSCGCQEWNSGEPGVGCIPVIPAFGRWSRRDAEFKANLSYIVTAYLKNKTKQNKKTCIIKLCSGCEITRKSVQKIV
jgi:hypothetical protein